MIRGSSMLLLFFMGYAVLTTLLSLLCVSAVIRVYCKRKGYAKPRENMLALILYAMYLGLVFYHTGSGSIYDLIREGFLFQPVEINLIPFSTDTLFTQYLLNTILFIPLGIFLPSIWPQVGKLRYIVAYGLGLSLFIELSQLFNARVTDIDDLFMNVLGAIIGFAIVKIIRAIKGKSPKPIESSRQYSRWMPLLYLGSMALGYLLLFNDYGLVMLLRG